MSLIGYSRVSTTDQNPASQHDALKEAGCVRIYTDKASGTKADRPQLALALEHLAPGDTLVVWRLDRLGRSLKHLVEVVESLEKRGVHFRSLHESFDTSTPAGRMVFHVFAALSEFMREVIHENTMAGLASARARGRVGGRKPKMTATRVKLAQQMYDSREHTIEAIASTLGVSRSTVSRHVRPDNASAHLGL